jgi:replication-associated recombination protein RarA
MSEEKVMETVETETESLEPTALDNLLKDAVKFFESLGKAIVSTAQDASNLMVVNVDADTREQLDLLVDTGVAETRRAAATKLIQEGLQSHNAAFDKIRQTHTQIAELRKQMRSLVGGQSS